MQNLSVLLNKKLIPATTEAKGWHASNYAFIQLTEDAILYYDFQERLSHRSEYIFEDDNMILADGVVFGRVLDFNESYLKISRETPVYRDNQKSDALYETWYFVQPPTPILKIPVSEFDMLFQDSVWIANHWGFIINFEYFPCDKLNSLWDNKGIPEKEFMDDVTLQFTLKQVFDWYFLIIVADAIVVESLPVHLVGADAIEFVPELVPFTIRKIYRVTRPIRQS